MMDFIQNLPFISIILSLFSGPLCSILSGKWAKRINRAVMVVLFVFSCFIFSYVNGTGEAFVYRMGHFSAPWGNEIRVGVLEALMAIFFCLIMFLCVIGGTRELEKEVPESKQNLFYVCVNLLLCSLLALIYTNDMFTAYVFVEINTISACGLIMSKQNGRTIEASTRYMIMSQLGSGLLLLGICFLYGLTGELLMSNIKEAVMHLDASGAYHVPLMVAIGLIAVGLAIKSALYPFHAWLPDAYGYSTISAAAVLSSLVSKGYIFLLVKIFYRVIGVDVIYESRIIHILFVFGVLGMIMGSVNAIRQTDVKRMIAYSSVAQIGYIYMGLGLGTPEGFMASVYHVLCHAATKSLLFVAAGGLIEASGGGRSFRDLTGAGYRNRLAGVAFTVGAFSMVGIPMFAGFISKLLFAQAAMNHSAKMMITLIALAISTILNAVYFMRTVIRIYTPVAESKQRPGSMMPTRPVRQITLKDQKAKAVSYIVFIGMNFLLGLYSEPIVDLIERGLDMFG